MDANKYNRDIVLRCPTCGCDQFQHEQGPNEAIQVVACASCGRKITKDDLLRENSENISEHARELGEEVVKDAAKELKESLKRAFRGNKNIRIQ